jgi:hypothetical protein
VGAVFKNVSGIFFVILFFLKNAWFLIYSIDILFDSFSTKISEIKSFASSEIQMSVGNL